MLTAHRQRVARLWLPVLLLALCGCDDPRERQCTRAVKALLQASATELRDARKQVVAFGGYALPEIEQKMHAATPADRLRLLEAVRLIDSVAAKPMVDYLARVAESETVRRRAAQIAKGLGSGNR